MIERNWNELIRPEKPVIETDADASRKARLVAEPLERGFGVTLGNALRRVLLSSLQGAAVTAIQIDGVVHEFSSLEGVREDVVDIVLNIKQLAVRMHSEGPKRMMLRAKGPGEVTASQIDCPADIEILNGDHVLCTLDEGAEVRMEFTVQNGKGYVPAERNRPEDAPIGLIAIDALYSPVKRVAYRVEPTRQGQSLDYDKLVLEVDTNGAVSPVDAGPMLPASCKTNYRSSSHSTSPRPRPPMRPSLNCRLTRRCSRRSMSWSCLSARLTA